MPLRPGGERARPAAGAPRVRAPRCDLGRMALSCAGRGRDGRAAAGTLGHGRSRGRDAVHAAFSRRRACSLLSSASLKIPQWISPIPAYRRLFPAAARMQRAVADLSGVRSPRRRSAPVAAACGVAGAIAFRCGRAPIAVDALSRQSTPTNSCAWRARACTRLRWDPCTRASSSPGISAFQWSAKKSCELEERLGYVHKGIERRFTELTLLDGHRLAARVSGDSAVAFSWAYCQALEGMSGAPIPPRAAWLRALFLELERVANHLGDLGALGNDAGFAFGLAQFSRLKEQLLRTVTSGVRAAIFDGCGRYPEGRASISRHSTAQKLAARVGGIAREARRVASHLRRPCRRARSLRRSGSARPDARRAPGSDSGSPGARAGRRSICASTCLASLITSWPRGRWCGSEGDVAARVAVRFDELQESGRLDPAHPRAHAGWRAPHNLAIPAAGACGVGLIEGWRGPVLGLARSGHRRHHPPLPSARSLVAELAGARARDHRQHRPGFPAHQQVVQPVLQRTRSVARSC